MLKIITAAAATIILSCAYANAQTTQCYKTLNGGEICRNLETGQTTQSYVDTGGNRTIRTVTPPNQYGSDPPKAPPIINYGCLMSLN